MCVGRPRPSRSKPRKPKDQRQPEQHSDAAISELSQEILTLKQQLGQLANAIASIPPPAVPHQCTISTEFAVKMLDRLGELESRINLLMQKNVVDGSLKLPGQVVPMSEVERVAILHALDCCGLNATLAAQMLEIGPATMYRKLREYGISLKELGAQRRKERRERRLAPDCPPQ